MHELVDRCQADGETGLQPRSKRPRSNPNQTTRAVEDEIIALRKQLHDQGLDAGAATIATHLPRPGSATTYTMVAISPVPS